ncbi:hypothetical protein D3C81_1392040 [compost metagenome]
MAGCEVLANLTKENLFSFEVCTSWRHTAKVFVIIKILTKIWKILAKKIGVVGIAHGRIEYLLSEIARAQKPDPF